MATSLCRMGGKGGVANGICLAYFKASHKQDRLLFTMAADFDGIPAPPPCHCLKNSLETAYLPVEVKQSDPNGVTGKE